jgi:hypothetical protein
VRRVFAGVLVALGLSFICFFALSLGGGNFWRHLARICVVYGALSVLFLVVAQLAGAKMLDDSADDNTV